MLSDLSVLSSQAIFPAGIAVGHIVLCLYLLYRRKPDSAMDRFFVAYLLLTALGNINLVIAVNDLPPLLPGVTWSKLSAYGLIILGLVYWAFARAFLHKSWTVPWVWVTGLVGLMLPVILDLNWLILPSNALLGSNSWINAETTTSILSVVWWGLFMALTGWAAITNQARTENPAHKNRIRYLLISTIILTIGYALYLSLQEPFWITGLIITGLGAALTTYIVAIEDLIDLGVGVRRAIRGLVVTLVTISVYVVGFHLVQILLGDFLATTFAGIFDHILLIATITAAFLTVAYSRIRLLSHRVTDLVFGGSYNYMTVIQNYGQVISNRLYLGELADVALTYINEVLDLQGITLFILDTETTEQITLRTLPTPSTNGIPEKIMLQKGTPITRKLVEELQALAQYTIDISTKFKSAPAGDRQMLKSLNYEWYIPIQKEKQLIGIFALGCKKSGQPYSAHDLRLLNTLADQTALALENAGLFDRVQRNLEEITRMKNLMDSVFDSMDDGVITTDIMGKITLYNQAAESILAKNLKPCLDATYKDALPALANTIFSNLVQNVIKQEDHYRHYEIVSQIPERGKVSLNISLTPLKNAQDQTQGVTIVMDDLTETKRLQAVHDMFRRYVSPAVVDRLPEDPADLELGGHRQEATILFADIRGFTSFSEKLAPEKLVDVLNQYLSMAASAILLYEGTLDKFMGDAVMGIFNAPLNQEDHVLRAVRAATAMQRSIADYHRNMGQAPPLSFGIGLHVGEVVVGNVGMSDRMDYTAIGDAVNLAKRIQENASANKVLMSKAVYEVVKDSVKAVFYQKLQVRGREKPERVYELKLA